MIRALAWRLAAIAALIAAALLLPGCGILGYQEVGLYFAHDQPSKSFALHWNRDTDPRWRYPDCLEPRIGIPTWLCPEVVDNDVQRW